MNGKDLVPIILIHHGRQRYLKQVIKCAKEASNYILLIGDKDNKDLCDEWIDMESLKSEKYYEFIKHYKHMSTNPYKFELVCFERFFFLWECMKQKEMSECIMMDSDIVLFHPVTLNMFGNVDMAIDIPKQRHEWQWTASAHFSFWTLKALEKFLDYIIYIYTNKVELLESKWQWHRTNDVAGGICDMTLLYLFSQKCGLDVKNTEENELLFDNALNDFSINEVEYKRDTRWNIKKIVKNKQELGYIDIANCWHPVLYIHAQGANKKYIGCLTKRNNSVIGFELCNIEYWIIRIYEKILRMTGIEKRFNW